ncbi:MAG TPA: methyltransferase domain-containing protein [Thermoanaerobaculia bacterium]|nr:methyltransferase domain-containing protein [Thermoanaerobaculia bacterium]
MTFAAPSPPAAHAEPERLDRGVPPAEAEVALRDLERVYRLLLGGRDLRRAVFATLDDLPPGSKSPWVLDLGAGGGHVAADLQRDAAARGRSLRVIGVDAKLSHLLAGRRFGSPQRPLVADAMALPLRDSAVACAFSHLFFHHFDAADNRRVLAEMRRVARAVVVVDLRHSSLLRWLVRPGLRLLRLGEVAYADGVVSVERSYRLREVAAVVAGMPDATLSVRFPFRWSLVLRGAGAPAGAAAGKH